MQLSTYPILALQGLETGLRAELLEQQHNVNGKAYKEVLSELGRVQAELTARGITSVSTSQAANSPKPAGSDYVILPSRSRADKPKTAPVLRHSPEEWNNIVLTALRTHLAPDVAVPKMTKTLAEDCKLPYDRVKIALKALASQGHISRATNGERGVQVLTLHSKKLPDGQAAGESLRGAVMPKARTCILEELQSGERIQLNLDDVRKRKLPNASKSAFANCLSKLVFEGLVVKERQKSTGIVVHRLASPF